MNLTRAARAVDPRKRSLASRYLQLAGLLSAVTVLVLASGAPAKTPELIDVVGESAALLALLAWIPMILAWRPEGWVTDWLFAGLSALAAGFLLDLLDEFYTFSALPWGSLESVATPVGVVLIALALYYLKEEQLVIGRQRLRREGECRDHRAIDGATDLYDASYLRQVLDDTLTRGPVQIAMVQLLGLDRARAAQGYAASEDMLRRAAQLLVAIAPADSLVCRYGGDRFVVLAGDDLGDQNLEDRLNRCLVAIFGEVAGTPIVAAAARCRGEPGQQPETLLARTSQNLNVRLAE